MKYIDFYNKVEKLLKEGGWCKHAFARNHRDDPVSEHSPQACSFCLSGAFSKISSEIGNWTFDSSIREHMKFFGVKNIPKHNDDCDSVDQVLKPVKEAALSLDMNNP